MAGNATVMSVVVTIRQTLNTEAASFPDSVGTDPHGLNLLPSK
jgi:hypothetical protein